MATEKKTKKDTPESDVEKKTRYKTLDIDGVKYRTQFTEKFKNREKWEKPDVRLLFSEIPGTILKVCAKEGDKVSQGDNFLVLESMKMKNRIIFPIDGTVKKIHVKENDVIPKGTLMLEMK